MAFLITLPWQINTEGVKKHCNCAKRWTSTEGIKTPLALMACRIGKVLNLSLLPACIAMVTDCIRRVIMQASDIIPYINKYIIISQNIILILNKYHAYKICNFEDYAMKTIPYWNTNLTI